MATDAETTADHGGEAVFGKLLRTHRRRALLTQEQLAERAGISSRAIRYLEHGRVREPRGGSVRLLADALALTGAAREEFHRAAYTTDDARPVPTGEAVLPSQLPPDIADFTGRADEVAYLSGLLTCDGTSPPAATVVAAVVGKGGAGKSTLAVHVAHRVRSRYPDGNLYVDLRGAEADPTAPEEVLGRFLRALGVDANTIPDGTEERACQYRSLLADRQVLVVLDNAGGEAQVIPLLPGSPSCGVLITSRAPLTALGGIRLMDLGGLDRGQALELLGRIVGPGRVAAEPAMAAELALLCGQLPLALRIAGARLAARPHWHLAELVARLADERRRLDELTHGQLAVRASLSLSYQALEPDARLLFCRLGLLQAPDVAAWVGAALLNSSLERATELTDRLVEGRLLEVAGRDALGHVRYRFHDLVRLYARERAQVEESAAERNAALARAFGAWLHLAERADAKMCSPLFEPVYGTTPRWQVDRQTTGRLFANPVAFMKSERAGLVAALTQAARMDMAGLSWELCSALTQYLGAHAHLDEWRHCTKQALAAARRAGDTRGEAAVLLSLGSLETIRPGGGRHRQALDCWQAALAIFEQLGEDTGRAMCMAALAVYRNDRAAFQQRRQQVETALAILDQDGHGNPRARACLLQSLGDLYHNHGQFASARTCFQQTLELYRELGSRRGQARQRYQLGAVLIKQGCDQEAVSMLRRALAVLEPEGDRMSGTPAKVCLGAALAHVGRETEARPLLEPWADSDFPYLRGWALRALGELDQANGHHDRARAALGEALRLFCELDMPAEEAATVQALESVSEHPTPPSSPRPTSSRVGVPEVLHVET